MHCVGCMCVPRNMLQAASMYNTLLESDDATLVIEVLILPGKRGITRKPGRLQSSSG